MNKSRPFLLLVVTLCMLLCILSVFWLAQLPVRLASQVAFALENESGLKLETKQASLDISEGLALNLADVSVQSIASKDYVLTADIAKVRFSLLALFGGALGTTGISLEKPILDIDLAAQNPFGTFVGTALTIVDGRIKLHDSKLRSVATLSEVSGQFQRNAAVASAQFQYVVNDRTVRIGIELEDTSRLGNSGTPADINISSKNVQMTFSGRVMWQKNLALDGQAQIDAAQQAELMDILGIPRGTGEFLTSLKAGGGVSTTGLGARFKTLAVETGGQILSGSGEISAAPERLQLRATLEADQLSLMQPGNLLSQDWSEEGLGLLNMHNADHEITIRTKDLKLRGLSMGAATLTTSTDPSAAHVAIVTDASSKGKIDAKLDVTASGLSLNMVAEHIEAEKFVGGLVGVPGVSGLMNLTTQLSMQGNTLAQLVSTMAGTFSIDSADLKTPTADPHILFAKEAQAWGTNQSGSAPFVLRLKGSVQDGIATIAQGEIENLKAGGEVDILRRAVDITFRNGFSLKGPWAQPSVVANPPQPKAN